MFGADQLPIAANLSPSLSFGTITSYRDSMTRWQCNRAQPRDACNAAAFAFRTNAPKLRIRKTPSGHLVRPVRSQIGQDAQQNDVHKRYLDCLRYESRSTVRQSIEGDATVWNRHLNDLAPCNRIAG